ncbi:unnamed protein product [Gadus morhua 'NCC']
MQTTAPFHWGGHLLRKWRRKRAGLKRTAGFHAPRTLPSARSTWAETEGEKEMALVVVATEEEACTQSGEKLERGRSTNPDLP